MSLYARLLIVALIPNAVNAQSNSIPPAKPKDAYTAASEGIDTARNAGDAAVNALRARETPLDAVAERNMGRISEGLGVIQHGAGAYGAYREGGAEGMVLYGAQGLTDRAGEVAGEAAVSAYQYYRWGRVATGVGSGVVGTSFLLGTMIGDVIKEQKIGGTTIEDHVTNGYWSATEWALDRISPDSSFDSITSEGAIERHRHTLRQQRAAQFSGAQQANQQAAANRAAALARESEADHAAAMNQMMMQLLPAAIAASQPAPVRPPLAAPSTVAAPLPELQYRQRCYGNGRRLGTNEVAPMTCWQEPVYPGSVPGRSHIQSPPLGSTFGTPPAPGGERGCRRKRLNTEVSGGAYWECVDS